MFFSSKLNNYTCRPKKLEGLCTYEFYQKYLSCRKNNPNRAGKTLNFTKDHPSNGFLVLSARTREVIPTVAYYQIPSTKEFNGLSILDEYANITPGDKRLMHMEKYAKLVSILFCPFRKLEDLKLNGSYRLFFRDRVRRNKIKPEYFRILKNIQDCHNAMAAGSPTDLLIQSTDRPDIPGEDDTNKKPNKREMMELVACLKPFLKVLHFIKILLTLIAKKCIGMTVVY